MNLISNSSNKITFRDATVSDIPELATLHSLVWRQTYEPIFGKAYQYPTSEFRKHQWEQKFASGENNWFCIVAVSNNKLIGFAVGKAYQSVDLPEFNGELNKLYLENDFKGRGIGQELFNLVCDRFLKNGIGSIVAFSDPQNPVGKFFVRMGAVKVLDDQGQFHGAYGWYDLKKLPKFE